MGIFDKAKEMLSGDNADKAKDFVNQHDAQIDQGVEKAGDFVDDKTGDKFQGQVDQAQKTIEDKTGNL